MAPDDNSYLREFFGAVDMHRPASPKTYVALYDGAHGGDPVKDMATEVEWAFGESAQLFSGHRGTGKSTELRRLKKQLESEDYAVILCDMEDHLHLSSPVDVVDFLMAAMGALAEGVETLPGMDGKNPTRKGYLERLVTWWRDTEVEMPEISAKVGTSALAPAAIEAEIKLNLKENPDFKARLQQRFAQHVGELAKQARQFVADCIEEVRTTRKNQSLELVVLFDSIEHIRGSTSEAEAVIQSVERLFLTHADLLRFPGLHVVYTVPPWLPIRAPGVAQEFATHRIPCVSIFDRHGRPVKSGLDKLVEVVEKREPNWIRAFGQREALEKLAKESGGYLREFLRLVQETLRAARGRPLPVDPATLTRAVEKARRAYLPLTKQDAIWLSRVHQTKGVSLDNQAQLPELARLFENMLVLTYLEGREWYDVHPLVLDEVQTIAANIGNTE